MNATSVAQYMVVGAMVLICTINAARHFAPHACNRLRSRVALRLVRASNPAWMRRLALAVRPVQQAAGGKDCGSCGSCGPAPARSSPVHVKR